MFEMSIMEDFGRLPEPCVNLRSQSRTTIQAATNENHKAEASGSPLVLIIVLRVPWADNSLDPMPLLGAALSRRQVHNGNSNQPDRTPSPQNIQ